MSGFVTALTALTAPTALGAQVPRPDSTAEALFRRAQSGPADSADRYLRRVIVEFGNSAWADDALLLLSQRTLAANPALALDLAERLRSDYPGSDLRPRAALLAGRASFEVGEPRAACSLLDTARAEGAGDVEFVNQVMFYRGRCTAAALAEPPRRAVRPDTFQAAPVPVPSVRPETVLLAPELPSSRPAVKPSSGFDVQVVAASSASAANALVRRLARAGLHARVVAGGGNMHRVRLGPFATSASADSAARAARRAVGGKPFVVRLP